MESKVIFHFVQGTRTHGIYYVAKFVLELVGFTDSNWEGDNTDRKSTYGYVFILASGPISWSSKKQSEIAISYTEAKYRGVVNATTQCLWLQGILGEFGIDFETSTIIYCEKKKYHSYLNSYNIEVANQTHRDPYALHMRTCA